jgi:hypothetical protein
MTYVGWDGREYEDPERENMREQAPPAFPPVTQELLERYAPIMADHPMWVERRCCNAPGCGDEDYFAHILEIAER